MEDNAIILSFSDCWQAIKQARWLIFSISLFLALLLFTYFLLKPPSFTAEGIFKGNQRPPSTSLSKALELMDEGESYSFAEDPKVFIKSYPVLEDVVQSLHLQLNIKAHKRPSRLKQIWHTLKAEKVQRYSKNMRPHSSILNVPVTSKSIIPDKKTPLQCSQLHYPLQTSCRLSIIFLNEKQFVVKQKKKKVGEGELGKPFEWKGGTFTLNKTTTHKEKKFLLSFIPLEAAIKSLEKKLCVKRSKNHKSLVHISFTHSDRHLATSIVNVTMQAYQNYLKAEGKRKISNQLSYLQKRQKAAFTDLEKVMEEHKAYLESHLDAGEMLMLEKELEFMAQKQATARKQLDSIIEEMKELHDKTLPFPELLEKLREKRSAQNLTLNVEGARELILQHQKTIDHMQMEQENYDYCLQKLSKRDFDSSSLSKVLNDQTLRGRFEKMHTLSRNLIDEKNWSEKERQLILDELETDRQFLIKHINDLKQGALLNEEVVRGRLRQLQDALLLLLLERYENGQKHVQDLALEAAHFPKKWLNEQKIHLNTKIYTEMIESITKLIETKNIGYHLDYISAIPIKLAEAPIIPNSPHLLLGFIGGGVIGVFLVFCMVFLREVWLGPTASYTNLKSEGKKVLRFSHTLEDLKNIYYSLKKSGNVLAIVSRNPSLAYDLCLLFSKAEEKILLIDLTQTTKNHSHKNKEFGQVLTLGIPMSLKEIYLGSSKFCELLEESKKNFQRVIFYSNAPVKSLETKLISDLCEQTAVVLRTERWRDLPQLPGKTVYVTESVSREPLSLLQIVPFLERITSFWKHSPLKPEQTENYSSSKT